MFSVLQHIKQNIKQPWGGFLPIRKFSQTKIGSGEEEMHECNIQGGLIGMTVDYLARFLLGQKKKDAFSICLAGAKKYDESLIRFMKEFKVAKPPSKPNHHRRAKRMLRRIKGLDDISIIYACKLTGFDSMYRSGLNAFRPIDTINPDDSAILNIRTMTIRTLDFFKRYGPVTVFGPTFPNGYTNIVSSGDGDFLTKDTIWDLKTTKKQHRLKSYIATTYVLHHGQTFNNERI